VFNKTLVQKGQPALLEFVDLDVDTHFDSDENREKVDAAIAAAGLKRPNEMLGKLRLERFAEGRAAQLLHTGPYSAEAPNIERLHAFIAEQGGKLSGRHHEIYLSDPRRVAPERLKTIIRQPFAT